MNELVIYLYEHVISEPRLNMAWHWVMSPEWFDECLRMTDAYGRPLWLPGVSPEAPVYLLGYPVVVDATAGVPRLCLT